MCDLDRMAQLGYFSERLELLAGSDVLVSVIWEISSWD